MTAVVSRERAKSTGLTAAAGVLMLAVAVVMMVVAAPVHGHARAHGPARAHAAQLTTDLCHQLTSRSDSAAVRACGAGQYRAGKSRARTGPNGLGMSSAGRLGPEMQAHARAF